MKHVQCRSDQMTRRSVVLLGSTLLVCVGCLPRGEDRWKHFIGGGFYSSGPPSMSPDGAKIVYSSPRTGNGDIYQVDREGSNQRRITDNPKFESHPLFSPDGSTIAFLREADGCRHIWLMSNDGTNQKQLTFGDVLDDLRAFSPDGSELAFDRSLLASGMGRHYESFAIKLRGEQALIRKLEGFSQYSPDGKRIAYTYFNQPKERFEVWMMDADNSNKRFLAVGNAPRFSPDGNGILYARENFSPESVWLSMTADGINPREIGRWCDPVFTSDGKHIIGLSPEYQREIWKMDADGSNRERLEAPTGYADFLQPCRNGFMLRLVTGKDRVGDIYVIDTQKWSVEHVTSMR